MNPRLSEYGHATRFSSTNQPKGVGRKPAKIRKFLKDNNIGIEDIQRLSKNILISDREKLQEIANDKKQPILLSGAAAALLKDLLRGKTDALQWLADRGFGKAPQEIHNVNDNFNAAELGHDDRENLKNELLRNFVKANKDEILKILDEDKNKDE